MTDYTYSIELFLKPGKNPELGEVEFSKALALPRRVLNHEHQVLSLKYSENEKIIAQHHCSLLNEELKKLGYKSVEFTVKGLKTS